MYCNDPYTELYHYGIKGMKWGVRKKLYQTGGLSRRSPFTMKSSSNRRFTPLDPSDSSDGRRPFTMKSSSNRRLTPLDPSDGTKDWGSHIRSNAREMYRQGRRAVGNAYEGVKRAAGNAYDKAKDTYDKASSAVNAGFKAAGLERYQSAILIGGGIALAGAATAGGIALYKHHKKKQAEKNKNKN